MAIVDHAGDRASAVAEEARLHGAPAALGVACDVRVEAEVAAAFDAAAAALGSARGLFCSAGIDMGGMAHELEQVVWDRVLDTNLRGVYLCCKHALRRFLADDQGGAIVCTSSVMACGSIPGGSTAYSVSKAGILALVRSLAVDYARYGVRVNAILPGATETPLMWANVASGDVAQAREIINLEVPLGRLATPDEPAQAAVWLLSDEASYVTGSHLVCDGGVLARLALSA
ncbi:MAG: family oxidoreductase [Chloroflexi bacterium]|nr:family oxidoreductase [Chloroflexota bacterium]